MRVKIVRFRKRHAKSVATVFSRAVDPLRKSKGGLYPDWKMNEWIKWATDPGNVIKEFKEHRITALLAEVNREIVGLFGYQDGTHITREGKLGDRQGFARFRWLFVDPEFQGIGIARMLHAEVEEEVKKRGYRHGYVYVILSAHGFYEKMGWIHNPMHDSYPEDWPYDAELNKRIARVCQHLDYTRMKKTPNDFFFEKFDL